MPQIDKKIDYIEFPADDFGSVQSFYEQTFGWKFTDYGPEYCSFSDDKTDGGFYKSKLKSTTESGGALIVLYAEDLEAVQKKVIDCGGSICREIISFPGGRRFQFLDPHGNELGVWSDK